MCSEIIRCRWTRICIVMMSWRSQYSSRYVWIFIYGNIITCSYFTLSLFRGPGGGVVRCQSGGVCRRRRRRRWILVQDGVVPRRICDRFAGPKQTSQHPTIVGCWQRGRPARWGKGRKRIEMRQPQPQWPYWSCSWFAVSRSLEWSLISWCFRFNENLPVSDLQQMVRISDVLLVVIYLFALKRI